MTGSNSGLAGPAGLAGLIGVETCLTVAPSKHENSSKVKDKKRPSFKELLAKYEKERIAQKQKSKAKDMKPSSKRQEQSGFYPNQGNYATFDGPIAPWYCWYSYFYSYMDYSRMHI